MGSELAEWQERLDRKIDRLLNDVEFIKNRTAIFLGNNEAVTYLADETPIFVNTDDRGCPLNFLSGGRYEEENFRVLLSFRKPGSVFLDIGANLGVFSLRIAPYLRNGKVHSFEPIPKIRSLFSRSVFLNGYRGTITIHPYALSDHEGEAVLSIEPDHAGGASLQELTDHTTREVVSVRRLDEMMGTDFCCDIVKIDVEGHEMHTLRGMQETMRRSPACVVMFEKLAENSGIESDLFQYSEALGWQVYAVEGVELIRLDLAGLRNRGGYFVVGRPEVVESGGARRDFFEVYPADINVIRGTIRQQVLYAESVGPVGAVLFHGPYWFLPRGTYRIALDGRIKGSFRLELCERFGYKVADFELREDQTSIEVSIYRDLCQFECVLRSNGVGSVLEMNKITFTRRG